MCCLNTLAVCSSNYASNSLCKSIHAESKLSFLAMGELASTVRQNGARSFVLPDTLYSSHACSATILRKRDVETGHVASQLFFSASLRLKAWMDIVVPVGMFFSSCATSMGHEMWSFDPLGMPAKSFSRMTWWGGLAFIFSPHVFFALGTFFYGDLVGASLPTKVFGANNPRENPDFLEDLNCTNPSISPHPDTAPTHQCPHPSRPGFETPFSNAPLAWRCRPRSGVPWLLTLRMHWPLTAYWSSMSKCHRPIWKCFQ